MSLSSHVNCTMNSVRILGVARGGDLGKAAGGESSWLRMDSGWEHSCPRGGQTRQTGWQGDVLESDWKQLSKTRMHLNVGCWIHSQLLWDDAPLGKGRHPHPLLLIHVRVMFFKDWWWGLQASLWLGANRPERSLEGRHEGPCSWHGLTLDN